MLHFPVMNTQNAKLQVRVYFVTLNEDEVHKED